MSGPANFRVNWDVEEDQLRLQYIGGTPPRLPFSSADLERDGFDLGSPSLTTIQELWADELLEETGPGRWVIPLDKVYELDSVHRSNLEIPQPERLSARVRVRGIPGHANLRTTLTIEHPKLGRLSSGMPRQGPFFMPPGRTPLLLEEPLFRLLERTQKGPDGETLEDHFLFLSDVKKQGVRAGADLASFFETEQYYFPDKIQLEVEENGPEELQIRPCVSEPETPYVSPDQLRGSEPPRVRSFSGSGRNRQRVVFSPDTRRQVREINQRPPFRGNEVPRFLENPEAFLPEGIDLEDFSKRVKGLRTVVYNSRPYLHLRPSSEGGWFDGIPGVHLEDPWEEKADEGEEPTGDSGAQRPPELSPETYRQLVEEARRTGSEYVRYGDSWIRIDQLQADQYLDQIDRLEPADQGQIRLPYRAVLDIYENLEELEFELSGAEELGLHLRSAEFPNPEVPSTFNGVLKTHQVEGYRWLAYLDQRKTGGLLADDMGLGKTVQVIVHMARLAAEGRLKPSLVVCPKTLIENWRREIVRFFPEHGRILCLEGGPFDAQYLSLFDIVIASYDTVRRQQLEMAKVNWQFVASDEAQYVKNPTAQRTSALKALKSAHRVALTGTPVENGLVEFWCILDFVRPGLLGSWKDFRDQHERPLIEAEAEEERKPLVDELLTRLGTHYIRRMKQDILKDLPPKDDRSFEVELSEEQMEKYRRMAREALSGGRGKALGALTKMLILCGHQDGLGFDGFTHERGRCPKLDATLKLLREIQVQDEKVVLFTRFKNLQHILQAVIRQEFDIWADIINGEVNFNRQRIIDIFSSRPGFNALILSHEVGGVGLNITAANHVIHYTRPWNPAKENQATDRLHRIGQEKPVTVYRPIATHPQFITVEQRLDLLLKSKSDLARDVLRPSKDMAVQAEDLWECVEDASKDDSPVTPIRDTR